MMSAFRNFFPIFKENKKWRKPWIRYPTGKLKAGGRIFASLTRPVQCSIFLSFYQQSLRIKFISKRTNLHDLHNLFCEVENVLYKTCVLYITSSKEHLNLAQFDDSTQYLPLFEYFDVRFAFISFHLFHNFMISRFSLKMKMSDPSKMRVKTYISDLILMEMIIIRVIIIISDIRAQFVTIFFSH